MRRFPLIIICIHKHQKQQLWQRISLFQPMKRVSLEENYRQLDASFL